MPEYEIMTETALAERFRKNLVAAGGYAPTELVSLLSAINLHLPEYA